MSYIFPDSYDPPDRSDMPEPPPLMAIPNMFRLLKLVDEYDSRGTVEKIVIDQHSLGQFLNTAQPGSYHSVSKIDLTELDKLSIRPLGVYGIRSEIIKFLQQAQYLNDDSATLLSRDDSFAGLGSGLYLALDPNHQEQGTSRAAYIIYWPEDTTWDDQAASSSVQRNRVIFIHYLNKLTDQIISLISSAQAQTLIWDTNIYNEDLPEDQQDDDNARLVDFEVTESLKQEEDVIGSPGFKVIVDSGLLPQVDEQTGSRVRLVPGEQRTALWVIKGGNDQLEEEDFENDISSINLKTMIGSNDCPLQLGNLTPADLDVLAAHGLRDQYGKIFAKYNEHLQGLHVERTRLEDADKGQIDDQINRDKLDIRAEIQHLIRVHYNKLYPSLRSGFNSPHGPEVAALLHQRYPHLGKTVDEIDREQKLEVVRDSDFQSLKEKWPLIKGYLESNRMLSDDEHEESIDNMLRESNIDTRASANSNFTNGGTDISDLEFVSQLRAMGQTYFSLFGLIRRVHGALRRNLETLEQNVITDQLDKVISIESRRQKTAASAARGHEHCEGTRRAFNLVIQELREAMASDARQMRHVDWIKSTHGSQDHRQHSSESVMFRWGGRITWLCPTPSHHSIYPLELTEQDSQLCRVDEAHVPQPKVDARHKFEFTLPKGRSADRFIQLVGNKCLVVVSEREQKRIFLEADDTIDHAINANLGKISFSHDSLGGPQCQFAFDETTRLLAIVHGHEHDLKLSVYIFGELFTNLRNRGSPISLRPWYENQPIIIKRVCFVSELEEVCLVEASGRTRIFSLITQQFRAEFLQIDRPVIDAFSAPDGSCLFVVVPGDQSNSQRLLAFHWASFGSNPNGIDSAALPSCDGYRIATRFLGRGPTHVVSFDAASKALGSVVLQIMQKETEFLFRSRTNEETHNSLIDCHLEVWTQFPLIPSITRDTPIALNRRPRQLIFASPITLKWIEAHFASIISTFARKTKKPMAQTLTSIRVKTTNEVGRCIVNATSEFKLGSFIVELLCLIPLRLAVAKDDCLIPLKDGVRDSEFEHSLLGASVPSIVDAMSLGWYESLFQSYMATKPVRVVSAMGEQGAGKSYYLNHFAGTSFLGSKMSTADGVWLSCTPTEDYLLVSLDFRAIPDTNSAAQNTQDNMVLVLLNTAISNLLLLRNGFETSRNVSGLFRAFQSAVGILDSDAYQELFNSSLAIIIKDIANTDSKDIVNEFALKFQRMVEHERGQNFITRLHNGCVQIIPWPVIDSPSFYTLFGRLRQRLEQQPFTYSDGGTFLYNLKTLIAKINTNDWGSMYSNIAACRAQRLMAGLPIALSFGRHEEGPLKNMDTDEDLETPDYMPSLFVPEFAVNNATQSEALAEQALRTLIQNHGQTVHTRQHILESLYIKALQESIYETLYQRLSLVQKWIQVNTQRFPPENQDIRSLTTKIQAASQGMRSALRLCSSGCSNCQLMCLRAYRHSGEHSCGTSHQCIFDCDVSEEHSHRESCGLAANHGGRHVCDVKAHSCGLECHLSSKGGCVQACIKPLDHEGEHVCSARMHICGKPCDLRDVRYGSNEGMYSCPGVCTSLWDKPHDRHACENARACPIECILCRRLCCNTDHFHGLVSGEAHLCGQQHSCAKLCDAEGICQIEARPSAIQERFCGQHETFMYTRYTQVYRRLQCVIPVPPGELSHKGVHTHDTGAFHYCNVRCPSCEYLCMLPYGHAQQLHETSHGSMTTTQWVLESDKDDAGLVYELQGRKFGSGDDGTPMFCHLVCAAMGRHAHIDYCRRDSEYCSNTDCEHITKRIRPNPDREKDWISHATFWARSGFKDPYSREQQKEFSLCDVLCAGPEHEATATSAASPSYCTLPMFHPPQHPGVTPTGYTSVDGHSFKCRHPSRLQQAYHIVFVIDGSGSMANTDRRPLPDMPISARLISSCNNRYGAVLSALYGFWLSRDAVALLGATQTRQDAYSIVTFNHRATVNNVYFSDTQLLTFSNLQTRVRNDFTSSADQLIAKLLSRPSGGVNAHAALTEAQSVIRTHWSNDRAPVVIFLSDGECKVEDGPIYDLCRMCVQLGKAPAFYSISIGEDKYSTSLRRMAKIAHEVFASAPQDLLTTGHGNPCEYVNAIDSIQLAGTFLGITNSLQKPRASLMNQYGPGGRRAAF
ncbi:unnamed protein product [Rhizoctonia solani]|uniref:VWFA domain-containing protein n=1 Tax=Rhizoctonia solani TaxID=456999 RepID=A0A8H2WES3_9AGAM|nr:unnamed protein product [Rhizoctonia solani]